ncbi:MAG TPA: type II toxin-antitoxin system HipA family toxin [Rhodocyclaceae bacterium]|nr:type II toxin-antitoxin system HipA family toxin [Rhodocyclaceae bacterium]
MKHLFVWIRLPHGETAILGELAFGPARSNGTAPTAFRYDPSWLSRSDAFSISPDPQALPLDGREFQGSHLGPPLQVFDDALPDDWGRRLIIADRKLPLVRQTPFEFMRAVAGNGLGALSFSENDSAPDGSPCSFDLAALVATAVDFEAGLSLEDRQLRRLCAAGSSPGGARPKALVTTEGKHWLAKFPSPSKDNSFDVVGLEAVSLFLAGKAGLDVPEFRLKELGSRRILLIERFDRTPQGGRRHMITLKTLCRESGGVFCSSYDEPAAAVRKYTDDPGDMGRFFRQMTFNAAIGNTDDHLKNFLMLRDANGWRLSPAFDLTPDIGRNSEHVLNIGTSRFTPSGEALRIVGSRWLGCAEKARRIVHEVVAAVSTFHECAERYAVSRQSIEYFARDIERRLAIMEKQ